MINITNKRIITICKLKSLGISDNKTINKVLNGNIQTIKAIYNQYIRGKNILLKEELKGIIDNKLFRISNYKCTKCNKRHYFNQSIYDNHYKWLKVHFGQKERQGLISETLDYIIKRHYNNNKNNKEFQRLIEYIDVILSNDVLSYMNNTLRSHVITNYKTEILKTYNAKKIDLNEKIEKNIQLLKEIIKQIDYINFMNKDITKLQRIRIKQCMDIDKHKRQNLWYLIDLMNTNKDVRNLVNKLDYKDGIMNNKALYNKILSYIKEYENKLYQMKFGINSYNNKVNGEVFSVGVLPFSDSGKFESKVDKFEKLESIILYCFDRFNVNKGIKGELTKYTYEGIDGKMYKTGYKARVNYILSNPNLVLITNGKMPLRRTAKNYICYKVKNTTDLENKINKLKYKAYMHLLSEKQTKTNKTTYKKIIMIKDNNTRISKIDFIIKFDVFENKINTFNKDINLRFDYWNYRTKTYNYNKYNKELRYNYSKTIDNNGKLKLKRIFKLEYYKYYKLFYPTYVNKDYLYCSFGHLSNPPKDPLADINKQRTLGNLRHEYIFKDKMNKDIRNLIEWINIITKKGIKTLKPREDRTYFKTGNNKEYMIYDNTHLTNADLIKFKNELIIEYKDFFTKIFNSQSLNELNTVKITFGKRLTYRNFGYYYYDSNSIKIQKTLQYNPIIAIKGVIFHELLHIQYDHVNKDDSVFLALEKNFKQYDLYNNYNHALSYFIEFHAKKNQINGKYSLEDAKIALNEQIRLNYNVFKTNLKQLTTYKNKGQITEDLMYIINHIMHKNLLNKHLRQYILYHMNSINTRIKLKTNQLNRLTTKHNYLYNMYLNLDNKRTKNAKSLKKQYEGLSNRINRFNKMFTTLNNQRITLFRFYTQVFNRITIKSIDKIIINLLITQIKYFNTKTVVRYVNSQRNITELIRLGINNMSYNFEYVLNNKINKNKVEVNFENKFDEILNCSRSNDKLVNWSNQTKIPIKSLLLALIKMNFVYDDAYMFNKLIYHMDRITKPFQNIETTILNT